MLFESTGEKIFRICNNIFLIIVSITCLLPIINVLALSFSSSTAAFAGDVSLWPVGFTLASYKYVMKNQQFYVSFGISLLRVALAVPLSTFITILTAYPLSKEQREFPARTFFAWFLYITILFSGGMIPLFITVNMIHINNSIWALVLPGSLAVFNIVLTLNFIRTLPKETLEAAYVDGAGHWRTLWQIVVPMSIPVIATITLFSCVGNWNSWFDGLIYINSPEKFPLQTYLQTMVVKFDLDNLSNMLNNDAAVEEMMKVSNRSYQAAQIFIVTLPILFVYPFLQRYFISGIVIGSVKE
jgi:putative aldouronate transport system permease protein